MRQNNINLTLPLDGLETLIIDCVNACLKHYTPPTTKPATKPTTQKYGNAKKAGQMFGIHANSVRNWAARGHIKKYVVDGSSLYCFEEIDQFLQSQKDS